LIEVIKNKVLGDGIIDDKTMIMERVIALVADLPHQSKLREELTNNFLNELWNTLDHPPLLYVGDQYRFRMADGSFNVGLTRLYPNFQENID
jgi:prostaglandin-endoperoxide synthase 1/linoleate 10R-lipoxygenase